MRLCTRYATALTVCAMTLWPGLPQAAPACLEEATEHGRIACLDHLADLRLAEMELWLATAAASAQGATAAGIVEFERGLYIDQTRWRRGLERSCRDRGGRLAQRKCRLDRIDARERQLRQVLDAARLASGAAPDLVLPDQVEVLVPLPAGPNGALPYLDLEIPLTR